MTIPACIHFSHTSDLDPENCSLCALMVEASQAEQKGGGPTPN